MGWFAKAIGGRIGRKIGEQAAAQVLKDFDAGAFDHLIEAAIMDTVRKGSDDGLSLAGFILKITAELIDRSRPPLPYKRAHDMAVQVYQQFRQDNGGVKFGHPDWDWSGSAARTLAQEYEIDHWEPVE
jgi:hypothetical protein